MIVEGIECTVIRADNESTNVVVSVICQTYNRVGYIRDCFESILMQKVNFDYEIIVFDDASTDGTTQIIEEYCNNYPSIFSAFICKTNTYRFPKRYNIIKKYRSELVKGKYVAFCECDDYWIDCYRLQMQVDFLNSNPDYMLTMGNGIKMDISTGKEELMKRAEEDFELSYEDIIMQKDGMWPTASMVGKREIAFLEQELMEFGIGDWPMQLYSIFKERVFYFGKPICVYRYMAQGSWSVSVYGSLEAKFIHYLNMILLLTKYNEYTNCKYEKIIKKRIGLFFAYSIEVYQLSVDDFEELCKKLSQNIKYKNLIAKTRRVRNRFWGEWSEEDIGIKQYLESILMNKRIYVFSASIAGKRMKNLLNNIGLIVEGYIDNDEKKNGTIVEGVPVYSYKEYLKKLEENFFVLVGTLDYDTEICLQLEKDKLDYISATRFYCSFFS